jgi:dTDP-4-dehydrorhamnose reductase
MKIIVLGASGMLGSAIFSFLKSKSNYELIGTFRNKNFIKFFPEKFKSSLFYLDLEYFENIHKLFSEIKPDIVINCIGLIKQECKSSNPILSIKINSLFPQQLSVLSFQLGFRLIHFSTDCVYSGLKGNYSEDDTPDPVDLYGRSKLLGEFVDNSNLILRTSIIGNELEGSKSLINWFISQKEGSVNGFKNAFFSGLPTIEIALILDQFILHNPKIKGLYHLGGIPISKFELLNIVNDVYNLKIDIVPNVEFKINRVLNSNRFLKETGYQPKPWNELISMMKNYK